MKERRAMNKLLLAANTKVDASLPGVVTMARATAALVAGGSRVGGPDSKDDQGWAAADRDGNARTQGSRKHAE